MEQRLQRLLSQNPLRTDFQQHYEEIVAAYNHEKDRVTIERTFEALLELVRELDEEENRAVREGLDEESLAIFDLLKKPDLSAGEIARIKKVAVSLLEKLKAEKLQVDQWREKEATRDSVRVAIRDFLWSDRDRPAHRQVHGRGCANDNGGRLWPRLPGLPNGAVAILRRWSRRLSKKEELEMTEEVSTVEKWLIDEDSQCFEDRISRLEWLSDNAPAAEYWTFPGGLLAKSLFEEARYCFVYGQFLATIVLGLAYIERTLAALFYTAGRNDLERAGISRLLREAHAHGLIDDSEMQDLERIRKQRNVYAHFRRPGHEHSLERRAILENELPYSIVEQDATAVMTAALHMIAKNGI